MNSIDKYPEKIRESETPNLLMWSVFTDCNFTCNFCPIPPDQLKPKSVGFKRFYDLKFHDQMIHFLSQLYDCTSGKWVIMLTGGEPLLMPNLEYLTGELTRRGFLIRYNTNLSVAIDKKEAWLTANPPEFIDTLMVSIHPESLPNFETIFERIRSLKVKGYRIVVRMVAHPDQIDLLAEMEQNFRNIGVAFTPLSMLNGGYPQAYKEEEFFKIRELMKSKGELVGLYGGLDVADRKCYAGSRTLCIHTSLEDSLGAIFACNLCDAPMDLLDPYIGPNRTKQIADLLLPGPVSCFKNQKCCDCPALFEHDIVLGMEGRQEYNAMCEGPTKPHWEDFVEWVSDGETTFYAPPLFMEKEFKGKSES